MPVKSRTGILKEYEGKTSMRGAFSLIVFGLVGACGWPGRAASADGLGAAPPSRSARDRGRDFGHLGRHRARLPGRYSPGCKDPMVGPGYDTGPVDSLGVLTALAPGETAVESAGGLDPWRDPDLGGGSWIGNRGIPCPGGARFRRPRKLSVAPSPWRGSDSALRARGP